MTDSPSIDELRTEIDHTRAELSATVDALAGKLDVKSRAKGQLNEVKAKIEARTGPLAPYARPAGIGAAVLGIALVIVRRRRSR